MVLLERCWCGRPKVEVVGRRWRRTPHHLELGRRRDDSQCGGIVAGASSMAEDVDGEDDAADEEEGDGDIGSIRHRRSKVGVVEVEGFVEAGC